MYTSTTYAVNINSFELLMHDLYVLVLANQKRSTCECACALACLCILIDRTFRDVPDLRNEGDLYVLYDMK
jgi:hypothetical protein